MGDFTVKSERRTLAPGRNKRSSSLLSADFEGSNCEFVKIELDAAHTLAEFAQVVQRNDGCLVKQWGRKERRKSCKYGSPSQRSSQQLTVTVKEEGDPVIVQSLLEISSTNQQPARGCTAEKEDSEGKPPNTCHCVQLKNCKLEPVSDPNLQPNISALLYQHGNKLRQPLTEIEKEARRLRRVQANRESARKTIRRKQALRDELSQKAAQLVHENETMKEQKDLLVQEYNSIKDRNKQLKEQMKIFTSLTSVDQACKTLVDSKASDIQMSDLLSKQTPLLYDNEKHLPPFLWAATFIQASSATQTPATENKKHVIPVETKTLPTTSRNMMSNSCTNHYGNSQSYVPPFFLPYMLPSVGVQPVALHVKKTPLIATAACASSACDSRSDTAVGDNILVEAKGERMAGPGDLDSPKNQMFEESSIDSSLQKSDIKPQTHMFERTISVLPTNTSSSSIILSKENNVLYGGLPYDKNTLNYSGNWSSPSKDSPNSLVCCRFPNIGTNLPTCVEKRLLGAAAASDARKRRKELTRSKHIQARQLKLHC